MKFISAVELIGLALFFSALFFRRPAAPRMPLLPTRWVPFWRQKGYFSPAGLWLMAVGWGMFAVAFIMDIVAGVRG